MARQLVSPRQTPGRLCAVPGCTRLATGYRKHCENHRRQAMRHGDPEQRGIAVGELQGHRKAIERFINRRDDRDRVWSVIEAHWRAFAEWAQGELREMTTGLTYHKPTKDALESIRNVADTNEPREVMLTLMALFKLWYEKPQRFRSDRAAMFQAARALRSITDVHVEKYRNGNTGKLHRVFRDMSPRVLTILGQWLFKQMLPLSLNVIREIEREEEAEKERVKRLYEVIKGEESSLRGEDFSS